LLTLKHAKAMTELLDQQMKAAKLPSIEKKLAELDAKRQALLKQIDTASYLLSLDLYDLNVTTNQKEQPQ
jgi:hypothetical protein